MVCPNCGAPLGSPHGPCQRCTWVAGVAVEAPGSQSSAAADPEQTRAPTDVHQSAEWTPSPGSATLQAGQQFTKRYTIIKLLGAGGMGEVYHAWDEALGAPVALKIVRPDLSVDPIDREGLEQRFKRELRLARQVTHPNVVRIHDLGDVDQVKYLTMEYVQGADLRALLRRYGKLPIARALSIARQVAAGLEAVHKAGIVHRDLKPANVIIDAEDHALLTDFGIARAVEAKTLYTMPGAVIGTLEYMAPEQARGEAVDQRSDIYAFGLILYDLIAGGRPSSKSDGLASLIERLEKGPSPLSAVDPSVPADTERIVTRCLGAEPSKRYQNISEVLSDLDRLGPDGRFRVQPPPSVDGRRQLGLIAAATAVIAVVVGAGVWQLLGTRTAAPVKPRDPITVLIADFENKAGDPVFEGSLEQPLGVALEGASFITAYPRKDATQIALKQGRHAKLDEKAARLVAISEGVPLVFVGTISGSRSGYQLTVKAVEPTKGDAVTSASADARSKSDVLQAVGHVADSMRRALGDTTPSDQLAAETFTAASLDAVKYYTIAQTLSGDRKNDEAIDYYKKAIQEDPKFGRAYAGWATAAYDAGRTDEAKGLYDKALELVGQMTEREKYRTLGAYFINVVHNNEKAMENYKALVTKYPSDFAGHNNLAVTYFNALNFSDAKAEGRRALDLYPRSLKFQGNYALYAMYAGDFKAAADAAREIVKKNPTYEVAYLPLAMEALAAGDIGGAKGVYSQAGTVGPEGASLSAIGLADVVMFEGRPADAVSILPPAITADLDRKNIAGASTKTIALAEAQSLLNQTAASVNSIETALSLSNEVQVIVPAARLLLRAGQEGRAQGLIQKLGETLQPQSRAYAALLEAEIALAHNRTGVAMEKLAAAKKQADLWLVRFMTAVAYERAGHHVEARDELEKCSKRLGEATSVFLDDMPTFRYTVPMRDLLQRVRAAGVNSGKSGSP
jgi:tetratricopeptide (TPR) repeat protein/tRNA A-37 threonylcarbamoyl transferase component Bud32